MRSRKWSSSRTDWSAGSFASAVARGRARNGSAAAEAGKALSELKNTP